MSSEINLYERDSSGVILSESRRIKKENARFHGILHVLAEAEQVVALGALDGRDLAKWLTSAFHFHPRSAKSICGRLIGSDPMEC